MTAVLHVDLALPFRSFTYYKGEENASDAAGPSGPARDKLCSHPGTLKGRYFLAALSRICAAISFMSVRSLCISLHPYHNA